MSLAAGIIAILIQMALLVRPHNRGLLLWLPCAMFFWALHYALLGSYAASALHVLAAATMWVSHAIRVRSAQVSATWFAGVVVAVNLGLGAALYRVPADIFMILGNALFAWCHLRLRGRTLRVGYLIAEVWIAAGAWQLGSAPGVAIAVLMITANVLALSRWQQGGAAGELSQ